MTISFSRPDKRQEAKIVLSDAAGGLKVMARDLAAKNLRGNMALAAAINVIACR